MAEREAGARASSFRRLYGAGPFHLVGLLACFLVAGYAALHWLHSPSAVRLVVWFVGALLLHDFVLFPLYSLLDSALRPLLPRRGRPRVPLVNHVRVPLLLSGLLLLLWFPLILNKPEAAYHAATGLDTSPYLDRWLSVTAVLIGASALVYAVRWVVPPRGGTGSPRNGADSPRNGADSPRNGAEANSVIPSSNPTEDEKPSS